MTLMDDATGASSAEQARLIELAQGGDRDAFTTLFQRYHPRICTYLGRLLENDDTGRDLAQETFVQAWQRLPHLRDTRSFEAWLCRIATNLARSLLRRERLVRWLPWGERGGEESWQRIELDGPEEQASKKECMALALAQVSPQNRTCLLLQVVAGFSQHEIAGIVGISQKTVSAYVSRGREQFRAAYQQIDSDLTAMPLIEPRSVYAEQLPERSDLFSSPVLAGSTKSTPSQQVERPGEKRTRTSRDVQEKPSALRRVRMQHMVATLAAVLVVCALTGGAALLFSRHSSSDVGAVSRSGPLTVYAALTNGTVYALRPDSGAIRWQRQLNLGGQTVIGGPTIAQGVVYVGATNGSLYALRASDGNLLWQHALGAVPDHPVAGNDPQVIYVGAGSTLYALRTSNGSVLWHQAISSGASTAITAAAPLAVADGRVYASDGAAGLLALASGDGHIVWQGAYYNGVALVVAGNKIFTTVGTGAQIGVLRASDGHMLHMLSVQGNLGFDQGRLYVANRESGKLFILRPQDEHIIGQVSMACPVSSSPAPLNVQDGLVYTYGYDWVCAMHVESGQKLWRWTGTRSAASVTSLIAANHHLYFLYTDGDYAQVELFALNSGNGVRLWKFAFTSSFPYGGSFAVGN